MTPRGPHCEEACEVLLILIYAKKLDLSIVLLKKIEIYQIKVDFLLKNSYFANFCTDLI